MRPHVILYALFLVLLEKVCAAAEAEPVPAYQRLLPRAASSCGKFGPGNVPCGSNGCYNPSAGESCCSGGTYCPAGQACSPHGCSGRTTISTPTAARPVTTGSSCASLHGQGNVPCGSNGCYNPSAGESCCKDGTYCPAGQSCSPDGCIVSGTTTSTSTIRTTTITPTVTTRPITKGSDCASQYGPENIPCGNNGCYNPSAGESCCSDGGYCPAGESCIPGGGRGCFPTDSFPTTKSNSTTSSISMVSTAGAVAAVRFEGTGGLFSIFLTLLGMFL